MGLVWRVWESQVEPWIGYSHFERGLQGSLQLSSAIVSGCLGLLFVLGESREISSSESEVLDMLQKEAIDEVSGQALHFYFCLFLVMESSGLFETSARCLPSVTNSNFSMETTWLALGLPTG